MFDTEFSCSCEFYIGVDLLLRWEIRLSDDRLRVDDEISVRPQILSRVSNLYLESLRAESVKKRRIGPIRTRHAISETLVVASKSGDSDSTDTDDMEMFASLRHRRVVYEKMEKNHYIFDKK